MKKKISYFGVACSLWLVLAANGCRPPRIHLSSPAHPHPDLRGRNAQDLADMFSRKATWNGLNLSVMLWDRAYVDAYLERRATRKGWDQAKLRQQEEEWAQKYLNGKLSFRVRLEALNRPMVVGGPDPVLEFDSWQWRLTDSSGHTYAAKAAKTETKQMFRGSQGRFNWRVLGDITFARRPDPGKIRWIELTAIPPGDAPPIRLPRWYLAP